MQTVTLVRVETVGAEASVLQDLRHLTELAGTPVAPVLDRAGLPERLSRVLTDFGCHVRYLNRDDLEGADKPASPIPDPSARLTVVLASAGVERDVLGLAAGLCGIEPGFLSVLPNLSAVDGLAPAALLLVHPERAAVADVASAMAVLSDAGAQIGIIYTLDPIESRFAILKALLLDQLNAHGAFGVLSDRSGSSGAATPGRLQATYGTDASHVAGDRRDLFILSGHSNPLDAALGTEAALCARAGTDGGPAFSPGLYTCFTDGQCFRQPLMGRSPEERAGLVAVQALRANIVVLSGCNVAALGSAWFNARHGLGYQCQQSAVIACIVSNSLSLERLELDFLLVALMAEELPLGQVVSELNRVRIEIQGDATAYSAHIGPLVLLGNPRLRVVGFQLQHPSASDKADRTQTVDLSTVRFDAERSAILRVQLSPSAEVPFIFLRSAPLTIWCRGVWYSDGDVPRLYLWLGTSSDDGRCDGLLELAYSMEDPTEVVKLAVQHWLQQVPFWLLALKAYGSLCGEAGLQADDFDVGLTGLSEAVGELSLAVAGLCPDRGIVQDERQTLAVAASLWQKMGALNRVLLGCLVEVACRLGTLQLSSWEGNLRRLDVLGPLGPCTCTNAIWGQRYGYPDGGRLERVLYQCPVCGPVGEDDGRRLLRLTEIPRSVEQGSLLVATAECRAPAAELLQASAVAVLESPFRNRRMVGDVVTAAVHPKQAAALTLSVSVPADLTPGVYPFALLGVVNGASCVVRQMLQVVRPHEKA